MSSDGKTRFAMVALAPGVRLNDTYEIDAHIASGGMGEVYRAHNIETGEPVAIKAMLPELARDEAIFALFKKEATLLGRLRHDTIVHYYSFSRDPAIGQPYLAMEFVEGQSLSERIAAGPLGVREVATLFIRIAGGLAVAHEAGIIHRDLSPDNIILSGGDVRHPRIIDFGIARSVRGGDKTLVGSNFAGKFDFVSPEQLDMAGGEVTQRSDIYSLALVMVAALSGRALNMGRTPLAVIEKRRVVPDLMGIDAGVVPLLTRMLAPEPADRPADMADVADWLRAYLAGRPPTAAPTKDRSAAEFESPFGPGPIASAPASAGIAPAVATAAPPRPRFGMRLATSLVALLAIGVGGAYLGGLFDGEDKIAATEPVPAPLAADAPAGADAAAPSVTDAPQASGVDAPQASSADGKPPEPSPTAKPETTAAPDTTAEPQPQTAAAPDSGPTAKPAESRPESATTAIEPQRPASKEATAARGDGAKTGETGQVGSAPAGGGPAAIGPAGTVPAGTEPAATDAAGAAPVETIPVEAPPTQTAAATMQGAVAAPADPETVPVEPAASPGDCFFTTVAEAPGETLALRGFAPSPSLAETIGKTVVGAGASPPLIDAPVVTAKQCAVVDFLKAVHARAEDGARLTLSPATPNIGGTLTATIAGADDRPIRLLAVDGKGAVRLLGSASKGGAAATVSARLDPASFAGEVLQIVVAIVGDVPLDVPEGDGAAYSHALPMH